MKNEVLRVLREIARLLELKGESAFKSRAYDAGADRLAGLTEDELRARVAAKTLTELPGIGEALAQKVSELVETGRMTYHENLRVEVPAGLLEVLEVPDVGPRKAAALWQTLGVTSLDALEAACRQGLVADLKGFGAKTQEKLTAGIALVRRRRTEHGGRRKLGDVLPLAEDLLTILRAAPGVSRASVAGSLRRFSETVGDVDLVVAAPDAGPVFDAFLAGAGPVTVLGRGTTKMSVRRGDFQIDVRVLPEVDFATALHHFTGSKAHHVRLRGLALERGLSISEWGVTRGDTKLQVADEAGLYALLGLPFIPPELREDRGELDAALAGRSFEDLVTLTDIQGNVHAHSTWSDGKGTLEEMARAARAMGLTYLTVTEHSPTASYARGVASDGLRRQWDEIQAVNETVQGIRLLRGAESDILQDGGLDYSDAVLDALEVVIGSIHQRHGMDGPAMTARVLAALEHPRLQIWGHPTGRLLGSREASEMDLDSIFASAAEKGVVVEVNGSPDRLDLSGDNVRLALRHGLRLACSTDAHAPAELGYLRLSVGTARRGGARRADVVNTLDADGFLASLR